MNGTQAQTPRNVTAEETAPVSVLLWRSYLIQRRRSLRTELVEIEGILQRIAEDMGRQESNIKD